MLQIVKLSGSLFTDVSFEVGLGQIVAITGDNGSGKSTLAKTIAGYYQPMSGEINIDSRKIGLLTQNPFLQFIGNTVFDELTYSLEQTNSSTAEIEKVLANSPFDLQYRLDQLSGGQAQSLLIYKELNSSKQVLILDETLSNLDRENKNKLVRLLRASEKMIIFITNNLNDTVFADQVYHLENKKLQTADDSCFETNLESSDGEIKYVYRNYNFKTGINLITGSSASGKSHLITNFCFEQKKNISLIPQYPFEIVTTIDNTHLAVGDEAKSLGLNSDKLLQNITQLSTGELVKTLVLEAIASGNETIVIDEAIEVLDKNSQRIILDLLEVHFKVIIIVTHNLYLFNGRKVHVVEVSDEKNYN